LDRLLTVEEAAERLSTSTRFVRRLVAERRIAYVKVGRHVRLDPGEVEAFIVASRVETLSTCQPPPATGRPASPLGQTADALRRCHQASRFLAAQ
jgi:excisionase family DNA binding protein